MTRALILAPFALDQLERLRKSINVAYESWLDTRRLTDPDELALRLRDQNISILVVESDFVFEEVFEEADCLRYVGICRNETTQIDVAAATAHRVVIVNTPGRNAQAVAEHALGLMFALARKIPATHQYMKEKRWQNPVEPYISMRGVELAGRTLGIIGFGAIGRRLGKISTALEMNVIAFDPYVSDTPADVRMVSLDVLMATADFISVHVPATSQTEAMIDSEMLAMMKPSAYLVNCTATSVIDRAALIDVLAENRIAGAAFDVFETHPIAPDNPLLELDNVVLTPHIGGATQETIDRHSRMMTDDIMRFLSGKRPLNIVNPEAWSSGG